MNFRLRQERNAFVLLVLVAFPLLLLTAPLPFLSKATPPSRPLVGDLNGDGIIDGKEAAELARVRAQQAPAQEARL